MIHVRAKDLATDVIRFAGTIMQPWEAASELSQFRAWMREHAQSLAESVSITANVEPAVVVRVLDALHCHAMGGKAAGDPCLADLAEGTAKA